MSVLNDFPSLDDFSVTEYGDVRIADPRMRDVVHVPGNAHIEYSYEGDGIICSIDCDPNDGLWRWMMIQKDPFLYLDDGNLGGTDDLLVAYDEAKAAWLDRQQRMSIPMNQDVTVEVEEWDQDRPWQGEADSSWQQMGTPAYEGHGHPSQDVAASRRKSLSGQSGRQLPSLEDMLIDIAGPQVDASDPIDDPFMDLDEAAPPSYGDWQPMWQSDPRQGGMPMDKRPPWESQPSEMGMADDEAIGRRYQDNQQPVQQGNRNPFNQTEDFQSQMDAFFEQEGEFDESKPEWPSPEDFFDDSRDMAPKGIDNGRIASMLPRGELDLPDWLR